MKIQKLLNRGYTDDFAQSTVIGYALTLSICALIFASSILMMSIYLDQRNQVAAKMEAQSIANSVVSMITEAAVVQELIPGATYHRSMKLPPKISSYDYYVEATSSEIKVVSLDGRVSVSCSTFNILEGSSVIMGIKGTVFSGNSNIVVTYGN
jgi:hypothetical protein